MKGRNRNSFQTAIFFFLVIGLVGSVLVGAAVFITQLSRMENEIDEVTWQLPATIYAEPPSLSPGRTGSTDWMISYLRRLNYVEKSSGRLEPGQYQYRKNGVAFRARPIGNQETPSMLVTFAGGRVQSIVDQFSHSKMDQYTLEPTPLATLFGSEWEKRTLVDVGELPEHVIQAVIAIEDRRFYKHSGVDILSVSRAAINNLIGEGPFQGGSTITQQLVKNLYLSPEKTLRRKINEAMMAVLMEAKYSKKEILEFYLNEIYLGQNGRVSIKGIGEASQYYFKKDIRHLTVPEAATIAGLIQAPSRYDPHRYPEKATLRRNSVLLAMKEAGFITPVECEEYRKVTLNVQEPDARLNRAPYFLTYAKTQLVDQFSRKALHENDYRIISTLDYDMQLAAQQALSEGLSRIDRIRGRRSKKVQGSLIAIEPSTGKIRAFVGGRDFLGSQYNRVTQAQRQPGSSFKPVVYAAALETAFRSQSSYYTTSTLMIDEPWSLKLDRAVWTPQNYNNHYYGIVSLRTALAKSMNIATAKLAHDVGITSVYQLARKMGFENVKPYPSIALGAFEVTPFQLIQAYTAFANRGKMVELQSISRIVNAEGDVLRDKEPQQSQVLREETAYLITDMLKTVVKSGTGASLQRWGIRTTVAGKTGTTNDQKDAWFVGYTPDLICLVWVGYDDNTPVRMTGAQAALPIWASFVTKIQNRFPVRDFPRPAGIVEKTIDPYTGKLAGYSCTHAVRELFIQGTEPLRECSDYDHYMPMEQFVGPGPHIQHAYYNDYSSDYSNIYYDDSRYSYTNYDEYDSEFDYESDAELNGEQSEELSEEPEQQPEMVDYSDISFPDKAEPLKTKPKKEEMERLEWEESPVPAELEEQDTTIRDFETLDRDDQERKNQTPDVSPDQTVEPSYFAPKQKKKNSKKVHVYTNKDIPEAPSANESSDEEEQ
jgi:penicillin-binding protein 1B